MRIIMLATTLVGGIGPLLYAFWWATMPAGLYLSLIVTLLALVAAWIGYSGLHAEEVA